MNGSTLVVSDGSYFPNERVGACAWIISSLDEVSGWGGGGGGVIISDPSEEQSSYRSKLGGQTGIATVCTSLILPPTILGHNRHITTVCDRLAALETVGRPICLSKVKHKHVDLISLTTSLWNSSSFNISRRHVKAHQDDLQRPLTIDEFLNCKMDGLANCIAI